MIHVRAFTIDESLIVIIFKLFANFVFELACLQLRCRCMYIIVKRLTRFKLVAKKTCLWRFHKGHNQERFNGQRRSSMPIFEIQLVETKQFSQYDTHIHLCVVCEACKQSHVYTEHTVLYH